MAKYHKKPIVIEAFQWTGGSTQLEDPVWIVEAMKRGDVRIVLYDTAWEAGAGRPILRMYIETLEGEMTASPGDYIIRGIQGELYPCKPDIFEQTYELVED